MHISNFKNYIKKNQIQKVLNLSKIVYKEDNGFFDLIGGNRIYDKILWDKFDAADCEEILQVYLTENEQFCILFDAKDIIMAKAFQLINSKIKEDAQMVKWKEFMLYNRKNAPVNNLELYMVVYS